MYQLKLVPDVAVRLKEFINSEQFSQKNKVSKSGYWEHFADQLSVDIKEGSVNVMGSSGFYISGHSSIWNRGIRIFLLVLKKPTRVLNWFAKYISLPRGLMIYEKAFDAVMTHADISEPFLSPYRLNHLELAKIDGVLSSSRKIKKHYSSWSGRSASGSIINQYYHQNILRKYYNKQENKVNTIMEIGPGNGNLPSVLFNDWRPVRIILVDLPETLAISISFLGSQFPAAKLILPHEINDSSLRGDYDFAFLTVDQLDCIKDDSVDLSINCDSFQEMTHEQISIYFKLIQRVTRESGIFFTTNRVEKIPCEPDSYNIEHCELPNRFSDYPWDENNEILAFEISRFIRLVQLDDQYLRVERIHK